MSETKNAIKTLNGYLLEDTQARSRLDEVDGFVSDAKDALESLSNATHVKTVNGVEPDEDGNVEISIEDTEAREALQQMKDSTSEKFERLEEYAGEVQEKLNALTTATDEELIDALVAADAIPALAADGNLLSVDNGILII